MRTLLALADRAYLQGTLHSFCNGQVQYGHVDNATGYLRILSFDGYSKHDGFASGLMALESALDTIFSDPTLKALVIEVRRLPPAWRQRAAGLHKTGTSPSRLA
jgi:hypothetical protein